MNFISIFNFLYQVYMVLVYIKIIKNKILLETYNRNVLITKLIKS